MFGWEFPPHISGGLGTACYGLTRGLTGLKGMEVLFVVPRAFGDENTDDLQLIGANHVPVVRKEVYFNGAGQSFDSFQVQSEIIPYVGEEEFWKLKSKIQTGNNNFVETDENNNIRFSGGYGPDLFREIFNYALVAGIIAAENRFDIIHAHDWLAYPAGIRAREVSGKPLVIHVHATDFDRSGGNVNPKVYSIEREGMETADRIIAVSNFTRDLVIEKYGIDPEKITTVYNAVEPLVQDEKLNLRRSPGEKVVTFLGRITLQKGPEYFIEAANLVLKKMDNVRFVMAGSGDMMDSMVSRVAQLGIADRFYFTGFLKGDDVYRMFGLSDVFVMPSVSEPFGIVPLEAMQSDVPVIISKQSGVSEVLENALKVDFWDTYAMADAIYGLLNYPSLSRTIRELGKQEVAAMHWEDSAKRVKEVYESVLNR